MSNPNIKKGFLLNNQSESILTFGDALAELGKCGSCGCNGELGFHILKDITNDTSYMMYILSGDLLLADITSTEEPLEWAKEACRERGAGEAVSDGPCCDFTITDQDVDPLIFVGDDNPISFRFEISEINGVSPNSDPIYFAIPTSAHLALDALDGGLTTLLGKPVNNADWTYLGPFGGNHWYQFTRTPIFGANEVSAIGVTGEYSANGSSGTEGYVVRVFDNAGGECNNANQTSSFSITYTN